MFNKDFIVQKAMKLQKPTKTFIPFSISKVFGLFLFLFCTINISAQPPVTTSSKIKFTEGNNTFNRTVGDLLSSTLSGQVRTTIKQVSDYYQTGDDNATTFQRAIDATPENGNLYIGVGEWNIERTLYIKKAMSLIGEGTSATILNFPKDTTGIIITGGSINKYTTVKAFKIVQKRFTGQTGTAVKGVGLNIKARTFVDNIYITGFGGDGCIISSTIDGLTYTEQEPANTAQANDMFFASGSLGYIVSNGGNIQKTIDSGTTWFSQTSTTTENLNSVAFQSQLKGWAVGDNSTIIGTSDGGTTWLPQTAPVGGISLKGVMFYNATLAYIVGDNGTVFKTVDGSTWTNISSALSTSNNLKSVTCVDANVVVIAGSNGSIFRSADAGATWVEISTGLNTLRDIAFRAPTNLIAVGDNGATYYSTNSGVTWTYVASGSSKTINAISYYADKRAVIVGETGTILSTKDSGLSWGYELGLVTTTDLRAVAFSSSTKGFVADAMGMIWIATNVDPNINNWVIKSLHSLGNGGNGLLIDGSDVNAGICEFLDARNNGKWGVYESSFLGNSFGQIHTNANGDRSIVTYPCGGVRWYAIADSVPAGIIPGVTSGWQTYWDTLPGNSKSEAWAVGLAGTIIHTEDAGATWEVLTSGTSENLRGFSSYNSRSWAVGDNGTVIRSLNGKTSWTSQTFGSSQLNEIDMVNLTTGWIVGNGGLIRRTIDAGSNWTSITSPTVENLYDVHAVSTTSAFMVGAAGTIVRYNGTSYTSSTVGTDTYRSVHFLNSSLGFAVGDNGRISKWNGTSWTTTNVGTTNWTSVYVADGVDIFVSGQGKIIKSTDGGSTWSSEQTITTATNSNIFFLDGYQGWFTGDNGYIAYTLNGLSVTPTWTTQTSNVSQTLTCIEFNTNNCNGKYAPFDATKTYFSGGPVKIDNVNCRTSILNLYAENNQPPSLIAAPGSIIYGGLISAVDERSLGYAYGTSTSGYIRMNKGFELKNPTNESTATTLKVLSPNEGGITYTVGGTSAVNGVNFSHDSNKNIVFKNSSSTIMGFTTALNTNLLAGGGTPIGQGNVFFQKGIYLGPGSSSLRLVTNSATAPGFTATGDFFINRNASTGDPLFWLMGASSTVYNGPLAGYPYYNAFRNNGTLVTRQAEVDLKATATVTLTGTNNGTTNRTDLTADIVSGSIGTTQLTDGGVATADVANNAITYAKIQTQSANTLLGRASASGTGVPEAITVGSGLSFSGTTLSSTMGEAVVELPLAGRSVVFSSGATNKLADLGWKVPPKFNGWYLKDVNYYTVTNGTGTGGSDNVAKTQIIQTNIDTIRFARGWMGNLGYATNTNVCTPLSTGQLLNFYLDTIQTGGTTPKGFGVNLYLTQSSCTPTDALNLVHTSQYASVINYATSQGYGKPTISQRIAQNTLVKTLVDAGIWSKLDVFYLTTRGTEEFGKINFKNPGTNNLAEVGTITWADGQGLIGDGSVSDDYLTSYNPSSGTWNYLQNSASFGVWVTNDVDDNRLVSSTNGTGARDILTLSTNTVYRINSSSTTGNNSVSFGSTGNPVFAALTRSTSTNIDAYSGLNNAALTTVNSTVTSSGVPSTFSLLKDVGGATTDSASKLGCFFAGGLLTSGEMSTLYTALSTYFTSGN